MYLPSSFTSDSSSRTSSITDFLGRPVLLVSLAKLSMNSEVYRAFLGSGVAVGIDPMGSIDSWLMFSGKGIRRNERNS